MSKKLYYECPKCNETRYDSKKLCCDVPLEPYTGGQVFIRSDGDFEWRFFINGNNRAGGHDNHASVNAAMEDFKEVMSYTLPEEESDG